jgi:hypothetical protein
MCNDQKSDTAVTVTVRIRADPCPWPPGFNAPDHKVEIENQRSNKLYNVDIHSISVHDLVELDGKRDIIKHYPVISKGGVRGPYLHQHSIAAKAASSSGMTDEVQAITTYYDETQQTVMEKLEPLYDLSIP